MYFISSLYRYFFMLFDGARSSVIMRAFWVLILSWICVESVKMRNDGCRLEYNDRLEDALGICYEASKFLMDHTYCLDFSNISETSLGLIALNGKAEFYDVDNITMISNSRISTLRMDGRIVNRLELRGNKNLVTFEAHFFTHIGQMRISGNPQLSMESLKSIRKYYNSWSDRNYIQEPGECEYDESVINVHEFKYCKYVYGDLIMENTVGTHVYAKLHKITGCLRIINTELQDIDFLDGIASINETCKSGEKSEISGNKDLWIRPFESEKLKKIAKIDIQVHPEAEGKCPPVKALSKEFDCTHVTGDLEINGSVSSLHNLKTIQRIDGKIKVNGTQLESLSFPELKSFGNRRLGEPALTVINNPQLTFISFPKVEKVDTNSKTLISIFLNDKFNNADFLYKQFSKLAGNKAINIFCSFNKDIINLSDLNGCAGVSGDLVLKGTTGETNAKLKSIHGCLKVIDTLLSDLSFIKSNVFILCVTSQSEIRGNKNMCLSTSFFKNLLQPIQYTADEDCGIPCTLSEFEVDPSCNALEGDLSITGLDSSNAQGSTLAKIIAKLKRISGKLTVSGNTDVSLEFPELIRVGNTSLTEEAILIDGNKNLKDISFPKLITVETGGKVAIVVKGYRMTKDQAKILKGIAGDKELKLECDFSNKDVKDFAELDYCTSVKGDLLLKSTQGVLSTKIESIGGCLKVIDTDIDKNTFNSLVLPLQSETCQSGEKSEVKGNKKLCLVWREIKDVKVKFGKPIEFSFDESCELPCTQEEFAEDNSYCEQFNGELTFDKNTDRNVAKNVFEKIKRIKGRIEIKLTTFEEINFLQLVLIENPAADKNAVCIDENYSLRKLSMPRLKTLTSVNSNAVYITDNDGFRMSNELKNTLEKAMPPGYIIDYRCHEFAEISDFSRLEGCTKMTSGVHLKGKISGTIPKSKLSHIRGCLKVENTDLSSLNFLEIDETTGVLSLDHTNHCKDEHYIRNNENLCITPFLERQLKGIYSKLVISDNKPRGQCPVFCTSVNGKIPDHECNIVKGELKIQNDCSFDQTLALVEQIDGGLFVKDCSLPSLEEILPKLKNISSSGIPLVLENVENYSNLTEILHFELESENSDGLLIKITTNQEVPFMVDADLKAHFGSKRVVVSKVEHIPDGVCIFFDTTVEVKNCKTVEGDLILDEKTPSVSSDLIEITGCLVVKNTNMENYEFLTKIEKVGEKCRWNDGETNISNNSCIPYDVRRKTSGKLKELVESEENKKDCYECTGEILPGQECKVIIGDLEINQASTPELVNQLESVREIYGRLIIKNSILPQISLTQLTKIEASESEEPAIEITGNNELTSLQMPALVNATSKGQVVVKIEENKKLKKTAELTEQLGKATGSECGEGKAGACQFSQVKEPEKVTATKSKENTTEEEGVSKTVLIVLGVIGAILLVLGLVGVAVIVVLIKKKGAMKAKKGKGPGKPPKSTMSKVDSKNLPVLEVKTSKTKSMAVEKGTKSLSDKKKTVSKEATKEEASKEKMENEAPGGPSAENVPEPVPNAS